MLHEGFKKAAYRRDRVMTVSRFGPITPLSGPMQDAEPDIAQILTHRPDLDGEVFFVPENGFSMAKVYLAGDEIIKMPLAGYTEDLSVEINVQQYLYDYGLPVPEVTFVAPENGFFSMKKIDGIPAAMVVSTDDPDIGRQLGAFHAKVAMASLSDKFNGAGIEYYDVLTDCERAFPRLLQNPTIRAFFEDNGDVLHVLQEYVGGFSSRPYVLYHDDVNTNFGNLLIDENTHEMKAVIDFGCVDMTRFPEALIYNRPTQQESYLANQTVITGKDLACYGLLQGMRAAWLECDKNQPAQQDAEAMVEAAKELLPAFRKKLGMAP